MEDIYTRAEETAIGSWPNLTEAYKKWLKISVKAWGNWNRIQAILDARNAVAHGVGQLTRRQARKDQEALARSLRLIGIEIVGTRIEISSETIGRIGVLGRDFILWLDSRLVTFDS